MESKKAEIVEERMKWESDKKSISDMVKLAGEVVHLNVGGTHHMSTEREVLTSCPDSVLARMFNGLHELKKINDEVFLDRDGTTF